MLAIIFIFIPAIVEETGVGLVVVEDASEAGVETEVTASGSSIVTSETVTVAFRTLAILVDNVVVFTAANVSAAVLAKPTICIFKS